MISLREPVRIDRGLDAPFRPLVVELVGPAAAGKTSVLHALRMRDDGLVVVGCRPSRRQHVASAIGLAPIFLALHLPFRGLLWKEMKRIAYVRTYQRLLEARASAHPGAVVLDEGPIYMLARLLVFGGDKLQSTVFASWWRDAIAQWARLLDIVVWLDAPDATLIHRLRTRRQPHPVSALSEEAIARFMSSYREAYDIVVADLTAVQPARVLVFRTHQDSVTRIADRVASEIRAKESGA
jgi:predicted ATPase